MIKHFLKMSSTRKRKKKSHLVTYSFSLSLIIQNSPWGGGGGNSENIKKKFNKKFLFRETINSP